MTQALYTTVDTVRAALCDTVLPAAVAALGATYTSKGTSYPLIAPTIFYGAPNTDDPPHSLIVVAPPEPADDAFANLDAANSAARSYDEKYILPVLITYWQGDVDVDAQRRMSDAAYTIYRAVAGQIRTQLASNTSPLAGALQAPAQFLIQRHQLIEYRLAEGRMAIVRVHLFISSRT